MARVKIKVIGPYPAWDERARQGRLERADGSTQPVLLHPGAPGSGTSLAHARDEGRAVGAIVHPRVLHLKQVMAVNGVPIDVFDGFEGVSLARVLAQLDQPLPPRVAFEAAGAVADALDAAWARSPANQRVIHPGPTPAHLLLGLDGQLRIVGFRAPGDFRGLPSPLGYGAPEGLHGTPAMVYGIGSLLLELLGGELPDTSTADASRHGTVLRRSLIAVLAQPGPRLSETAVDMLRSCLAWKADERPALRSLAGRLGVQAAGLPSPGLERWARAHLGRQWSALQGTVGAPPVHGSLPMAVGPLPEGVRMEARGPTMVPEEAFDEPTEGASRLPTEQARLPVLGPDAPTVEDTEEIERTAGGVERTEALEEEAPEVTVSTPRPEERAPLGDDTLMSRFQKPPDGRGPAVPIRIGAGSEPVLDGAPAGAQADPADDDLGDWRPRRRRWPLAVAAVALLAAGGWWGSRQGWLSSDQDGETEPVAVEAEAPRVEDVLEQAAAEEEALAVEQASTEQGVAEEAEASAEPSQAPAADAAEGTAAEPVRTEPARTEPVSSEPVSSEPVSSEPARTEPAASEPVATTRTSAPPPASTARSAAEDAGQDVDVAAAYIRPGAAEPAAAEPAAAEPAAAEPAAAEPAAAEPAAAAPIPVAAPEAQSPPYTLRFTAGAGISGLEITCHGGRTGSGTSVTIPDALAGPCRVVGTQADGSKLVEVMGVGHSGSWTCFANGERACR